MPASFKAMRGVRSSLRQYVGRSPRPKGWGEQVKLTQYQGRVGALSVCLRSSL
jgi:hypothetical protein